MPTLKVIHEVGKESPCFEALLSLELATIERMFQKQKGAADKEFRLQLGQDYYYGRIWRVPETVERRRRMFRKWIIQVLEHNLGAAPLSLPEDWDPHPACCGH